MLFSRPSLGGEELAAIGRIYELRRELRPYVAENQHRWLGVVRQMLAARAIQGSNSIEGYVVTDEDALAAIEGEPPVDAEEETWQAVQGYRRAMTYALQQSANPEFAYTTNLIQSLHFMIAEHELMSSSAGLWRSGPVWVKNEARGRIVYEAPEADQVPALIAEMLQGLQDDKETPPLIAGAMAHLNLVMIHPFRDGNGRMARCWQTLILARERAMDPEYCSIEEYLGRETASYYQVLADVGQGRWNPHNDARPWVRYCLTAHFVQQSRVLRRVTETEELWRQISRLVETRGLSPRTMAALMSAARGLTIRNASYRATLRGWDEEISNQVATSDLSAMVQTGLLQQQGARRGAHYVASRPLAEIQQGLCASRKPIDSSVLFGQPTLFDGS